MPSSATESRTPVGLLRHDVVVLKTELLAAGLAIAPSVAEVVAANGKPSMRVRSGSCGGLDLVLSNGDYVNCPTEESFARESPYVLTADAGEFCIRGPHVADPVRLVSAPAYYEAATSRGTPARTVGQLCFDRLGIGLTNNCRFWTKDHRGCQFCSIGLNVGVEERDKELADILEVVQLAYSEEDRFARAAHLLLGGGTWPSPDATAARIAEVTRAVKSVSDRSVYAMLVPPDDLSIVDEICDAGVDEIAMNIELHDADSCRRFLPLKFAAADKEQYARALARSVARIGPVNTRSILIVGLESRADTLGGVRWLCEMGVMPILCPFRPLTGTQLENHQRAEGTRSGAELFSLAEEAQEIADEYDLPLGPTCIACQGNTLNVPGHPSYRYYGAPTPSLNEPDTSHSAD